MFTNLNTNFALCVSVSELDLKGYRIGLEADVRARSLDSAEGKHLDRDIHGCPKHGSGRQTFRVRKPAKLETATRDRGFESLRARSDPDSFHF